MSRPPLKRVGPGTYATRDGRYRIARQPVLGPRGGQIAAWWTYPLDVEAEMGIALESGPYHSLDAAAQSLALQVRGWSGLSLDSGTVYLIHFEQPFGHARHYLGWTNRESVQERLAQHRTNRGANLLKHVNAAGIGYRVVRTWPGGRKRERQLKDQKQHPRLCPICRAAARAGT